MTNKNSQQQLENIFLDVRKAYRLVYIFQSRVMDILKFIGDQTLRKYEGGWSKFSNSSPKDGKGYLDLWAWDWLNMYCYEFYFGEKMINGNSIGMSVWLVSDTGFYDSETGDKENISTFSSADDSDTKLVFVIGKNTWHSDFADFEMNLKKGAKDYVGNDHKGILLVKSFRLSRFANADETRKALQELITFCHSSGVLEMNILN